MFSKRFDSHFDQMFVLHIVVSTLLLSPLLVAVSEGLSRKKSKLEAVELFVIQDEGPKPVSKLEWGSFSNAVFQDAIQKNRIVLIDFYADWCGGLTKLSQLTTLVNARVEEKILSENIVCLRGDFTYENPEIQQFLRAYGVQSIPLLVVISKTSLHEPTLFHGPVGEEMVIAAIDRVVQENRKQLKLTR